MTTTVVELAGNPAPEVTRAQAVITGEAHGVPICTAAGLLRLRA